MTPQIDLKPNLSLSSPPRPLQRLILGSRKLSAEQPSQNTTSNFNIRNKCLV